ncbi:hypothetical protein XA68_12542 [Ophiocordyceps unilateralis]|uniref:Cutinase n=1 Tax=Ophiocordyceps unilateralis TaxID=268505 RepID=A0A2A9PNN8_OPHUN|nr:hypothetical protein XA68_12542 [Ophiocordyceps unilateralis]
MGQGWSFILMVGISGLAASARFTFCHNYVLISARGTRETAGPSLGFTDMIRLTLRQAPGGTEYDVRYPAARDYTQVTTLIGTADIRRRIRRGLAACPKQRYALLGYSQGATATLEALREMRGTPAERSISAVLLLGNPYQVPGQLSTVDELGGDSTRNRTGALLNLAPGIGLSKEWASSGNALNICYRGDPICSGPGPDTRGKEHIFYGFSFEVQRLGAAFLTERLKGYRPYVSSRAEQAFEFAALLAELKRRAREKGVVDVKPEEASMSGQEEALPSAGAVRGDEGGGTQMGGWGAREMVAEGE